MITSADASVEKDNPKKKQRRNYSVGKNLKIMTKAVSYWDEKKGDYIDPKTGFPRELKAFAAAVEIPFKTFLKLYLWCGVEEKEGWMLSW